MKKRSTYCVLAIMVLAGCQVKELETEMTGEQVVAPAKESKPFVAIIEDDSVGNETKTTLDNSGKVLWKQGDQVSIFAGSSVNECYQVTDESEGKTYAALNKISGSGSGSALDNNVAFYPYSSTATIVKSGSNYIISGIELPATQNYAEGSFGNGTFPMAAISSSTEEMNLTFKNVLGGLKLQLKGTATIASIAVTGNNDEILCGDAEVTVSTGSTPSINLTDATAKTVTLDCGAGVVLDAETATSFIVALPPMTMTGGFTVVVTDTEGKEMEIKTTRSQTITRSSLLKMPAVNYEGVDPYSKEPFTITSVGSTSVSIAKVDEPHDITLEYRKGTGNWGVYSIGSSVDLANGESIQFRAGEGGNENFSKSNDDSYYRVVVTGDGTVRASGNIMSLLDKTLVRSNMPRLAFCNLFNSCSKLIDASNLILPATSLADFCYYGMFSDCTSLTTAPELPATTLGLFCYREMFRGCTSLTTAPALPATTLSYSCYEMMFSECTSLTTAPELPATTLAEFCYSNMFYGCTSLTTSPELPATTLAKSCYAGMYYGCTSLVEAPALPVTTLTDGCYSGMFSGCTSLVKAPELPATTLADGCYANMFYGCTSLTTAHELPVTTLAAGCYSGMYAGCPITEAPELPATILADHCYYMMFFGCTSLTTAPELPATTLADGCYDSMFYGCTSLTTSPELPATTLASNCYREMFSEASSLIQAPALPAITLAEHCYEGMFHGTSLTTAPELPATTMAYCCYQSMFSWCTSLTTAPELPATTLADACYYAMFSACSSLTTAPELPATTLAKNCYGSMFSLCASLTIAPELPATTLAEKCYYRMFMACTSLTTAPELPAITLVEKCYEEMFTMCLSLNYVKALYTTIPSETYTMGWLADVSSSGTFVKSSSATWDTEIVRGYSTVPSGWIITTE